ncbi:MAG: hypothetical protein ACREIA_16830, partial [Opitutaceae bacterium]
MPTTQTAPNGSFTDRLFGLIGQTVDTVGEVQVARLARPAEAPAPTSQPRALSAAENRPDTLSPSPAAPA